jgi:hypothetical protein
MGFLEKFLNTYESRIIISIIWGLGLSALFRRACKGRNCIVIRGPKPAEMHNKVFLFDNKCYKYSAETTHCSKKDTIN